MSLTAEALAAACADDATDAGIRITAELEPLAGPAAPVQPPVYEGGRYQVERRWPNPDAEQPVLTIIVDNVPSQANRMEDALDAAAERLGLPKLVLDLSDLPLPAHLPKRISSWHFPHRQADAYLRDAVLDGTPFPRTDLGEALLAATPWAAGPLVAWFPQALVYGFWHSHLGKKRQQTKHARAVVSEIVGWEPSDSEEVLTSRRQFAVKGDPLNLTTDEKAIYNEDDLLSEPWELSAEKRDKGARQRGQKQEKLSEIGHGQVLGADRPRPPVFKRVTQTTTVSFAQLRRVSLGDGRPDADAAARALLATLALCGYGLAFGRPFTLRSGADLRIVDATLELLHADGEEELELPTPDRLEQLLADAVAQARESGVPLDGWGTEPLRLTPADNLVQAITRTWPVS